MNIHWLLFLCSRAASKSVGDCWNPAPSRVKWVTVTGHLLGLGPCPANPHFGPSIQCLQLWLWWGTGGVLKSRDSCSEALKLGGWGPSLLGWRYIGWRPLPLGWRSCQKLSSLCLSAFAPTPLQSHRASCAVPVTCHPKLHLQNISKIAALSKTWSNRCNICLPVSLVGPTVRQCHFDQC